ncbi:hypothetical protein P7C73_g40, partial [Tremellales sp. Uapishka_1]
MVSPSMESILTKLRSRPLPPLEPGTTVYAPDLTSTIATLPVSTYAIASMHLLNDDIHSCHLIAQDNEGVPTANLLHATLHRREGDYTNSKCWWRDVSSHPLMPDREAAKQFVDSCEKAAKGKLSSEEEIQLRERQWADLLQLVDWTLKNPS